MSYYLFNKILRLEPAIKLQAQMIGESYISLADFMCVSHRQYPLKLHHVDMRRKENKRWADAQTVYRIKRYNGQLMYPTYRSETPKHPVGPGNEWCLVYVPSQAWESTVKLLKKYIPTLKENKYMNMIQKRFDVELTFYT